MKTKYVSLRWRDLPAALLLMAAALISGTRLVATDWTAHLSIVQTIVFFGVIAGLALGYSRFSARSAAFIAMIYGIFMIPWQLSLTLPVQYSWMEKMIILIYRLQMVISTLILREPVRDSLLFLVVMFALYWVISTHAGYALTRHGDGWLAILPGGLAMFVIHSFDSAVANRIWYLAAYLFFSLILIARMTFIHQQAQWQRSRTALPPHISLDFIRYTILATFIIVMLAWNVPALAKALPQANKAWQPVRTAWTDTMNNFENLFASLRATVFSYSTVYSPVSSLGRGSTLTDTPVFQGLAPLDTPAGVRIYWRARVYDTYQNGQWKTTLDESLDFNPQTGDLPLEPGISRWQGQFTIISAANFTTLFTPPQPLWISRSGQLEYGMNPDGTLDISTFNANPSIGPGESYDSLASISVAPPQELRDSNSNYPSWISERYLQLPSEITPRTRELAAQITVGLETPYDKALAVTKYLRENIQYTPVLEEGPPPNQEPIDWFLFESKTGFCNYYSTAEIILLRSLGIPARWAVGYAQGELVDDLTLGLSDDKSLYFVRQRDAHAWPEVYFNGLGWVEFEPTVSQPDIARLEDTQAAAAANNLTEEEELAALREDKRAQLELLREQASQSTPVEAPQNSADQIIWVVGIAAILALLLVFSLRLLPVFGLPPAPVILRSVFLKAGIAAPISLLRWADRAEMTPKPRPIHLPALPILLEQAFKKIGVRVPPFIQQWARQAELPPLVKAYLEINRGLRWFGKAPAATDTPSERAYQLGQLIPLAEPPAKELVNQYQIGAFSTQPVDLPLAQKSAAEIRKLSLKTFLSNFLTRFQKPDPSLKLYPANRQKERNQEI